MARMISSSILRVCARALSRVDIRSSGLAASAATNSVKDRVFEEVDDSGGLALPMFSGPVLRFWYQVVGEKGGCRFR